VADPAVGLRVGLAEDLERLVLGRGGEGEVAGVGQQLLGLHLCAPGVELWIGLDLLDQLVVAVDRRVMAQYVQDETAPSFADHWRR